MTLQSNLSISPYFDDYDIDDQFYQYLFRANVSIQIRELNGLQSMLQKQIELFGQNILESGTIVSGCNFSFLTTYPYAKLNDVDVNGLPVIPGNCVGFFATSQSTGLTAFVIDALDGFESTDPNLKTIYLKYINSGTTGTPQSAFSSGDVLTITDANSSIFNIVVDGSGVNFSNTDSLVVTPQIAVNVTSGTFTNGAFIVDPSSVTNVQIVNIDTTTLASVSQILLTFSPRTVDLTNATANSLNWLFSNGVAIRNATSTMAGTVQQIFGQGATGVVTTDGAGRASQITLTNGGVGYIYPPYATIRSVNNSNGYSGLTLSAQNFLAELKVANTVANPVGNGYAFAVSDGVVFQKGYFLKVDGQRIIVSPYSQVPNNVGVAFTTTEQIVDFNLDPNLFDNALGSQNYTAPGSNRLKLIPTLSLVNTSSFSNNTLLPLVEWSEGQAFLQNQQTQYSVIGQEMAERTFDEAGNFILAPFNINTRAPINSNATANVFSIIVSPGTAYISGEKVQTLRDFSLDVTKGLDSVTTNNYLLSLNYGNYLRVSHVAGLFQYSTGDVVTFYDTAVGYTTNSSLVAAETITPVGNVIGTAHIRSMVLESGIPATSTAVYRLYLFDVVANNNLFNAKAVYYNGNFPGIADIVTQQNATSGTNGAIIQQPNNSTLVYATGPATIKNSNNSNYTYRTIDQTTTVGNNGLLVKSLASSPTDFYPFAVGALQNLDMESLYVVPLANDITSFVGLAGTVAAVSGQNTLVGTSSTFQSNATSNLIAGDWVYVGANSVGGRQINQVVSVSNDAFVQLAFNLSYTNSVAKIFRTYPKYLPVPFGSRVGLSANVDANQNILTLNFGFTTNAPSGTITGVGVNINRFGVTPATKTAVRKNYVKIQLSNNAQGTVGPWCLGVADVFRLNGVWVGNSSVDTTFPNYLSNFTVDINQKTDYVDLAWLTLNPGSSLSLQSNQFLLAQFDYFSSSGTGFYNSVSYVSSNTAQQTAVDSTPYANLGSSVNTWEVPAFYDNLGNYYDLLQDFDFRPIVANTVAPGTSSGTAPINPSSNVSFGDTANPSNDKHFPLPGSTLTTTIEQYAGRVDSLFVNKDARIFMIRGTPAVDPAKRGTPAGRNNMIRVADFSIPEYPDFSNNLIQNDRIIMDTKTTSVSKYTMAHRLSEQAVTVIPSSVTPRGYRMIDIKSLDDRISALEYYTSLNSLESDLTQRIIPSSIDGTLNRFKYGIFVDNFSNTMTSDLNNPQYAATIDNQHAYPLRIQWSLSGPGNTVVQQPPNFCIEFINQVNATGNVDISCVIAPTAAAVGINLQQQQGSSTSATGWGNVVDAFDTQMSPVASGTSTLYFYQDPHNPVRFQISRISLDGKTETLVAVSDSAVNLDNTTDAAFFTAHTNLSNWFTVIANGKTLSKLSFPIPAGSLISQVASGTSLGNFVYGAGKITFTHNPSLGTNYRVRAYYGNGTSTWRAALVYPDYTGTVACPANNQPNLVHVVTSTGFNGSASTIGSLFEILSINGPVSAPGTYNLNGTQGSQNLQGSVPGQTYQQNVPQGAFTNESLTISQFVPINSTNTYLSTHPSVLAALQNGDFLNFATNTNFSAVSMGYFAYDNATPDQPGPIPSSFGQAGYGRPIENPQGIISDSTGAYGSNYGINQQPYGAQLLVGQYTGLMPSTEHNIYINGNLVGNAPTGGDGILYLIVSYAPSEYISQIQLAYPDNATLEGGSQATWYWPTGFPHGTGQANYTLSGVAVVTSPQTVTQFS